MTDRTTKERLAAAIRDSTLVRVDRGALPAAPMSCGIPLAQSEQLVALWREADFHLDGLEITRLSDVTRVQLGATERFMERVLREEGELASARRPSLPALESWDGLFASLAQTRQVVMLECEIAEPDMLHLGEVVAVAGGAVGLRRLMRDGTWDPKTHLFRLSDVTRAQYLDRYSTTYARYAAPAT